MASGSIHNKPENFFGATNRTWAIFLISVSGLFLEMLLIRWISTEIRIFAYLQNTVLVACFLGLGIGCFTCRKTINLRQTLLPLTFLILLMAIPASRRAISATSELLSVMGDLVIWEYAVAESQLMAFLFIVLGLLTSYILLILIVDIFVPIGRVLGRLLDDHPKTIWAYSVNIAGSLVGIWLFVLLSYLFQPPFTWFLVFGLIFLLFINWTRKNRRSNIGLLVIGVILAWFAGLVQGSIEVIWSPYQKLVLEQIGFVGVEFKQYLVNVNNVGYQVMSDHNELYVSTFSGEDYTEFQGFSQYDIPLLLHQDPQTYLILGAGAGNDAAGGLRQGVEEIVAVEIDPAIISIGRRFHPERPYDSSAVQLVNDDARSYFATTDKKFDVISFGLLDSHTTTAMTNARLDHYVYTQESIAQAKSLLNEGGIMVLTFEAQKPFITDRMGSVLKLVFEEDPIAFRFPGSPYGWGGVMFIAGDLTTARNQIAQNPRLSVFIDEQKRANPIDLPNTTKIATDDWPYIYLESPRIPVLYYFLAGLMVLVFIRSYRGWQATDLASRWNNSHWHFFFLGAAFLLLEVQNISKASVVLGNTWEVNAVIISGILTMILLANWVAHRFPNFKSGYAYFGLISICIGLYFIDLAQFAFLPYATKAMVVGGLTSLPMFFSGIIFIRSFTVVVGKNEALGANLIGALVGAILQSVTFVTGIKALLLIVAGLYFLSLLTMPGKEKIAIKLPGFVLRQPR
jgi:spermidine synthase